jgi:predicted O-methyltransferase YrrM
LPGTDYVPPLYGALSDPEWEIIEGWYEETDLKGLIGEFSVPAMSMVQSVVMGSAITRIVQLGHYYGYSALLVGFMLRAMGAGGRLFSIDIDPNATAFSQQWIDRADLGGYVQLHLGDSAAEASLNAAVDNLGAMPQLILLDSSHQYEHTLRELDLWVPRMDPGSIMLLHDTSVFAQTFDVAGAGGVQRALDEWLPDHPEAEFLSLNRQVTPGSNAPDLVYKDGCGLGILQRTGVLDPPDLRVAALEEENRRLKELLERADRVLVDMKRSPSWRVTAPLRALKRRSRQPGQ